MNVQADIAASSRRLQRHNLPRRALNLALQGSGSHGAFGWGILDKFLEDGRVEIDGISATSSGALNAAVYAYGNMKGGKEGARAALETFWRKVSEKSGWAGPLAKTPLGLMFAAAEPLSHHWFEGLIQALSPYEFNPLNINPLRGVLESVVDFTELHRCKATELSVCATHVRSGRARVFSNRQITADAVLASACLPTLAQAVEIDGEAHWDGVYSGYPALGALVANAPSRDILIGQISPIERRELPRRAPDIQARMTEISLHNSLLREARALAAVTQLIDDDWIRPEHRNKLARVHIHAIRSDEVLSDLSLSSKFDSSWRFLTRLRDRGRLAAELWLDAHFDRIGLRSTIDFTSNHL
ncbi:MAG: patatin-like phospholipase family protein [Rhizomicrobium sp.]